MYVARSCLVRVLALLVIAAAIGTALTAVTLFTGTDDEAQPPPAAPTEPTATPPATQAGASPEAARATHALDAPGSGGRSRGELVAGTPLRIEGRSADGEWLAVSAANEGSSGPSPVAGWVPVDAVAGTGNIAALPVLDARAFRLAVVSPTPSATGEARPTPPPDRPDLVVREVFARDNHLVVVVANEGSGDASADAVIEASVDRGRFVRIDTGKALRPAEVLEAAVEGAYVQRRSRVSITLRAWGVIEADTSNNTFEGDVAPDTFNDIEVLGVGRDAERGHLVVELRNNSPIPLAGTVTLEVSASTPGGPPLLAEVFPLDVESGATSRYDLRALVDADPGSISVTVSTDAINDADSANNTYPR